MVKCFIFHFSTGQNAGISGHCNKLTQMTIAVYNTISTQLLPTPAKSHYTFNLRDLSKVFQGILMAEPGKLDVCTCI
jgi:dynein heavy chain